MAESKKERSREADGGERERENGEKRKYVGPVTVRNWDLHEFSLDWIKKQVNG
jgi:hypothetical protein